MHQKDNQEILVVPTPPPLSQVSVDFFLTAPRYKYFRHHLSTNNIQPTTSNKQHKHRSDRGVSAIDTHTALQPPPRRLEQGPLG